MIAIKKYGVFGGTFDPIHFGHIHLIKKILELGLFDELIVIPAGDPWQKKPEVPGTTRLEMAQIALKDLPVLVSDIEVKRSGSTYAIDSVRELKAKHDPCRITWILGSDVLPTIHTWKRIDELAKEIDFLIVKRPNTQEFETSLPDFISAQEIEIAALDISATQVRAAISNHADLSKLIPDSVAAFIRSKGLYGAA